MRRLSAFVVACLALVLALAAVRASANPTDQCGATHCYPNACAPYDTYVDFVIVIDESGSMLSTKNALVGAFNTWFAKLDEDGVNATLAVVAFGSGHRIVVNTTPITYANLADIKTKLDAIPFSGKGHEAGFEAIRCTIGACATANLHLNWRPGARRTIIYAADEDVDHPVNSKNRKGASVSDKCYFEETDVLLPRCSNSACSKVGSVPSKASYTLTTAQLDVYLDDLDKTHAALRDGGYTTYFLISDTDGTNSSSNVPTMTAVPHYWSLSAFNLCNINFQIGNPGRNVQNADLTGFNQQETYANLNAHTKTRNALQTRLLRDNLFSRSFSVYSAHGSDFVNNFFSTVSAHSGSCDACMEYACSATEPGVCLAPKYICDCAGVPYGSAKLDCNGVCGGPATYDCLGVCGGTAGFDVCGVCTSNPSVPGMYCKEDCAGNRYVLSGAKNLNVTYFWPSWMDGADYAAANPTVVTSVIASLDDGTFADALLKEYIDVGRYESSRKMCTFDDATYAASKGITVGNARNHYMSTGYLTGLAPCVEAGQALPPRVRNQCGVCVPDLNNPPFCQRDCDGWQTDPDNVHHLDSCDVCVLASLGMDSTRDDCGVCNGGNANMNECGECFGKFGMDGCGRLFCNLEDSKWCEENDCSVCLTDCKGQTYTEEDGPAHVQDECGQCFSVDLAELDRPFCEKDCFDKFHTDPATMAQLDNCGACRAPGVIDPHCLKCNSTTDVWTSRAFIDPCGVCQSLDDPHANDYCVQDCADQWYSLVDGPVHVTVCDVCIEDGDQDTVLDGCDLCTNAPNYHQPSMCPVDCKGNPYKPGEPYYLEDSCGECWASDDPDELAQVDRNRDTCGNCYDLGSSDPLWNHNAVFASVFGDEEPELCGCWNEPEEEDLIRADMIECEPGKFACGQCPEPKCEDGSARDSCGFCPENAPMWKGVSLYNRRDDCDQCCDGDGPEAARKCNVDMSCGGCFMHMGFDLCGNCMPIVAGEVHQNETCTTDCAGVYGGSSVFNECNVCVIAGSEEDKKCKPDCAGTYYNEPNEPVHIVDACDECVIAADACAGTSGGVIAGAVIGGLAAVALIAVAAVLFARYAKSAGLFASSKQEVGFDNSHMNPEYSGNTQVTYNPAFAE